MNSFNRRHALPAIIFLLSIVVALTLYAADTTTDQYGHAKVQMNGGALNSWNTYYDFEYLGDDTWQSPKITMPTSMPGNKDVEILVDGVYWKVSSTTDIIAGTTYTISPGGSDFMITKDMLGKAYVVTIKFTGTSSGTAKFEEYVDTKCHYILDDTSHELTSQTLRIDSDNKDHTLMFCVTAGEQTTKYGFADGSAVTSDNQEFTLTKESGNALTLPAGDYTYTVTLGGQLETLPDETTVSLTRAEPVPYVKAWRLNGDTFANGAHTFSDNAQLMFTAVMSNGTKVDYGLPSDAVLSDGEYILEAGADGVFTTPDDAYKYIYTLTLSANSDESEWTLSVSSIIDPNLDKISALSTTLSRTIISSTPSTYVPDEPLTIWFDDNSNNNNSTPIAAYGDCYTHSFLLGNGRMGVSWFGTTTDKILINDKTYYVGTRDESHSLPGAVGEYMALGCIAMVQTDGEYSQQQIRELNLVTGVSTVVTTTSSSNTISKELFVDQDNDIMYMRLTCYPSNSLNFKFSIDEGSATIEDNVAAISYSRSLTYNGETYPFGSNINMQVYQSGGTCTASGTDVTVSGASEIYMVCAGSTDYDMDKDHFLTGESASELAARVKGVASAGINKLISGQWDNLYTGHAKEFSAAMNSAQLVLDGTTNEKATVIKPEYDDISYTGSAANSSDRTRMCDMILFAFGRYLNYSSSRGSMPLPSNLQGIWAADKAPWGCDYHANINLQMNYWASECTNLPQAHMPFLDYLRIMADKRWKGYADKLVSGTGGWTQHLLNNQYGGVGTYNGNYVEAAAWNCSHIWQHYQYTMDRDFLVKFFPTIWGATKFYLGYLTTEYNGKLVIPNYYSPELNNGGTPAAHAQQLVWEHLNYTLTAARILGDDAGLTSAELQTLENTLEKMDTGMHTTDGYMNEWIGDGFTSTNHRHLSHLMVLSPFNRVSPYDEDPANFNAAYNSLLNRGDTDGDENAAWNTAWKMHAYAHSRKGDLAMRQLSYGMKERFSPSFLSLNKLNIFQIEGGAGVSAAMAEMLVQSGRSNIAETNAYAFIDIAPAMPHSSWPAGHISGFKTQGNYQVDYTWEDGVVTEIKITACSASPLPLYVNYYKDGTDIGLTDEQYYVSDGVDKDDTVSFDNTLPSAEALSDYTWQFHFSGAGDYTVITRGEKPDTPEPAEASAAYMEADNLVDPDGTAVVITPGTEGIASITSSDDESIVLVDVMFGTNDAKVLRDNSESGSGDREFFYAGMKWNTPDANTDTREEESYADGYTTAATPDTDSENTHPAYTEVNGFAAKENSTDGGLFLAPVGGNFLRFEPRYNGDLTIWLTGGNGNISVLDETGKTIDTDTPSGLSRATDEVSTVKFSVSAGKSYYIVANGSNDLGFVAVKFESTGENGSALTLDENSSIVSLTSEKTYNVTLKRTFTKGYWHPVVLPFSVSESKMREVFGDGVKVLYLNPLANTVNGDSKYDYYSALRSAVDGGTLSFTCHYYQMLVAGVPAFVCPSESVTNPNLGNVTCEAKTVESYEIGGGYVVTGAYASTSAADNGEMYYISNSGGETNTAIVYHSISGIAMKGIRAWIAKSGDRSNAPAITSISTGNFDNTGYVTTGISSIVADSYASSPEEDPNVYNLLGRIVARGTTDGLAPGFYIHHGKKIIVR